MGTRIGWLLLFAACEVCAQGRNRGKVDVGDLLKALRGNKTAKAVRLLGPEPAQGYERDVLAARTVFDAIEGHLRRAKKNNAEDCKSLLAAAEDFAGNLRDYYGHLRPLLESRLPVMRAWRRRATGDEGWLAGWIEDAAKLMEGGGQVAGYGAGLLVEASFQHGADAETLRKRAEDWAAVGRVALRAGDTDGSALGFVRYRLQLCRSMLSAKKMEEAAAALHGWMATLRPKLAGDQPPIDMATLFNEAVALGIHARLETEQTFVTRTVRGGGLAVDIPWAVGWYPPRKPSMYSLLLQHRSPDGAFSRQIQVFHFEKDSRGMDGKKRPKPRVAAKNFSAGLTREITDLKYEKKPRSGSVNKHLKKGYVIEAAGHTGGVPRKHRFYFFDGKLDKKFTFDVLDQEFGDYPIARVQAQAVIASMREER